MLTQFKECHECAKEPGSPYLCEQCVWVRTNYKPMPTQNWREEFAQIMNQLDCNVAMKMSVDSFFTSKLEEIREEIGKLYTHCDNETCLPENDIVDSAQQILTRWIGVDDER